MSDYPNMYLHRNKTEVRFGYNPGKNPSFLGNSKQDEIRLESPEEIKWMGEKMTELATGMFDQTVGPQKFYKKKYEPSGLYICCLDGYRVEISKGHKLIILAYRGVKFLADELA